MKLELFTAITDTSRSKIEYVRLPERTSALLHKLFDIIKVFVFEVSSSCLIWCKIELDTDLLFHVQNAADACDNYQVSNADFVGVSYSTAL